MVKPSALPPQIFAGFTPGSFCVIEQDEHGLYSSLLFNAMLSLSVFDNENIVVVNKGRDFDSLKLIQTLPKKTKSRDKSVPNPAIDMKIAFMYKNTSTANDSCSFDYGNLITDKDVSDNNIDVNKLKIIDASQLKLLTSESNFKGTIFVKEIEENVSLTSLLLLKSWTRRSPENKILITVDPLVVPSNVLAKIRAMADGVVQTESFKPGPRPYPEFDGVINVIKIPRINSLNINSSVKIDTLDIGFQWKSNRYFVIDKLSLPPDVSETASRTSSSTSGCSSVANKGLDF